MAYMNKNAELKNGYNAYIDSSVDDMGTQMDVGLLLMEAGDTYVYEAVSYTHLYGTLQGKTALI